MTFSLSMSGDVFASLRYSGWQDRAGHYVRGLMLDGRRRRIAERMSEALDGPAWAIDDTGLLKYGKASPSTSAAIWSDSVACMAIQAVMRSSRMLRSRGNEGAWATSKP